MDWIPLIASTIRLVDMHDSRRSPGDSSSQYNLYRETRSGKKDGLWLDVALTIIEYLREQESEAVGGFVSGAEVYETVLNQISGLTEEDVKFVLSALSTPAEIWFIERINTDSRPINSTKETNLLERSRSANAYRLAPAGKTATGIAANICDIVYIAGSAKNLFTAIKARDFWKITELSNAIIDELRSFRQEIELHREGTCREKTQNFFKERGDVIRDQIKEASQILIDADEFLSLKTTRDDFLAWVADMNEHGKPSFGHGYALESLRRVAGQTLKLLESFTQLVKESVIKNTNIIQPISFTKLSASLASKPYNESLYPALIQSFGPTKLNQPKPCPFDFSGIIEPEQIPGVIEEDTDIEGLEDNETRTIEFIAKHSKEIIAELTKGNLSLSKALQKGWVRLNTNAISDISTLIGTYCDPSLLDPDKTISISLTEHRETYKVSEVGSLTFDELIMKMEHKQ